MILTFTQWIQATDFFTWLRGSGYVYPVVLSLHMVGLALFVGMVLMSDLRILGAALGGYTVDEVVEQLRRPKWFWFAVVGICGVLLALCKAEEYYFNIFFRLKLGLLVVAGIQAWAYRGRSYPKAAAAFSLLLWIAIACAGRGIGYIEPPFGIHA